MIVQHKMCFQSQSTVKVAEAENRAVVVKVVDMHAPPPLSH